MASSWCFAESTRAKALGKHVFPARILPREVVSSLTEFPVIDLVEDRDGGLERLGGDEAEGGAGQRAGERGEEGGEVLGVAAVGSAPPEAELEHLWVRPSGMGRGIGRHLFEWAVEVARAGGAATLVIVSDPHAEAFYERLGARRVDEVTSKPPGRMLPRLRLDL